MDETSNADTDTEQFQAVGADTGSVYESIFREMKDAVFFIDVEEGGDDYRFVFLRNNASHKQRTGLSEDEFRGQTPRELLGDEQGAAVAANYRRCVEQREPIEYEEALEFPGGTSHWETKLTPIVENGDVTHIVGVARDITEQKEQEKKVQRLTRRFETVLETMSAAVFLKNTDGEYLLMNQACRELFDVSDEKVAGLTDDDILPPAVAEKAQSDDRRVIENGDMIEIEETVPTDEGETVRLTRKSPVYDDDGEITALCGVSTDITDRVRQERKLRSQKEQLDEFASVVSHDLRNPLNVAQGRAELLGRDCDSDHLAPVVQALDRMEEIVSDTLTLARQGQVVSDPEPIAIVNLVGTCWKTVRTDDATIEIVDEFTLHGDRGRLQHLFENLFRNAVEHGGPNLTVRVGRLGDDGMYVEDTGSGIPEDDRETVFDPGHTSASGGTGFGLTIVKRIAEAHGWGVKAVEGDDGGARFEFSSLSLGQNASIGG